jgi:transcriptional regulator with XRE-family HTH domain
MKSEGNLTKDWLEKHGDPEIDRFIDKNLAITEKVRQALEFKGWTKVQFAEAMEKSPSEVSKWLSGMHNLTLKSIIKMENALGINLIHCQPMQEYEYVFLGLVEVELMVNEPRAEYNTASEKVEFEIAM